LFGHVARMDETADARRILTGVHQSDCSRPVGHPYTSWMATLKSDLSRHNLTFEDAIELALDKSLWRLLVASRAMHWHGACRIMMNDDDVACWSKMVAKYLNLDALRDLHFMSITIWLVIYNWAMTVIVCGITVRHCCNGDECFQWKAIFRRPVALKPLNWFWIN